MPSPDRSTDVKPSTYYLLKILLLAVILLFLSAPARAGTCTITDTGSLPDWGTWLQSAPGTAVISTAGSTAGSTGTFLYGSPVQGTYTLTHNGANCSGTITITVTDTGGATGVTLSNFTLKYNGASITNGQSGLALPGGGKTLLVGATATYTSAVSISTEHPTFNIHVLESGHSATKDTTGTANIAFDVGLALNKLSDINFGTVSALSASTYNITTAGAVTTTAGTGTYLFGATSAGNIQIVGSTTDAINISVGATSPDNGVSIPAANISCAYNGGAPVTPCSYAAAVAPGAGKTLLLGVNIVADGTQAAGSTAAPTFTVSVAYQ